MTETPPTLVPIGQVAREHGITRTAYRSAISAGLITPADRGGRGYRGGFRITQEDAVLLITAAAVAALVGITLCLALRVIRETGGHITPDGSAVVIPVPSSPTTPSPRAA
jgi:hypothetical protein